MLEKQYYIFPGNQKLKKHLIRQYMIVYIIVSTLKYLVLTITG